MKKKKVGDEYFQFLGTHQRIVLIPLIQSIPLGLKGKIQLSSVQKIKKCVWQIKMKF